MDVFTLMGGRDWMRPLALRLDGPTTRDSVGFQVMRGKANRISVVRKVVKTETVYFVTWHRVSSDGEEAEEVQASEVKTARGAADLIESSLRGVAKQTEEPSLA